MLHKIIQIEENISHFINFQQNFQKELLKGLTKWILFLSDHCFCEENFFASMQRQKIVDQPYRF